MRALLLFVLLCVVLPLVSAGDIKTCQYYLKQPCDCGTCSWLYKLEAPCKDQNLTMCVRGGYYDKGPNEDKCCSPDYGKMIIITVVVIGIIGICCALIIIVVLVKKNQKKRRQAKAIESAVDTLPPTIYGFRADSNEGNFDKNGAYVGDTPSNPLDDWRSGKTESFTSMPRQPTTVVGFSKGDSFFGR